MGEPATELQRLLMRAIRLIEDAIYSDNGANGEEGQAIMDDMMPLLSDAQRAELEQEAIIRENAPET